MPSLLEELQPIALKVEEARTQVVDAAREWCREGNAGEEEKLKTAVKGLDEVQMALGLKTAQLLLNPPRVDIAEAFQGGLEPLVARMKDPPPPRPPALGPDTVGLAWTKRRSEE